MLTLHHGNRLEGLAGRLADRLAAEREPFGTHVVVVPNGGMARWLALRVADANQLCAGVRFRLPAAFVWETFRTLVPALPETSPFDGEVLAWRVAALLGTLSADDARLAPVRAYLAGAHDADDAERRRFQLAERLAALLEQYVVYRPDWVLDWDAGRDDHWQAALWRTLVAGTDGRHRARLQREVAAALARGDGSLASLPRRLSVFGLSALPPADLWLLALVARVTDVHVFLLNPCAEHPGAVKTPRQVAWVARERDPEALHVEIGHPLYASLGRQGREFFELILAQADDEQDAFEAPAEHTLLGCLQADMLHLRRRDPRTPIDAADASIQVHVCHSPMREVEVLHDQLLALFAAHPELRPADVVVMTPDIERYAPCIEAVFASGPRERQIRYAVADRSARAEQPLAEAFFGLLELGRSRLEVDRLMALLEVAAVRQRFGLADPDLDLVLDWVRDAGIRWGADAAGRAAVGLPDVAEHTWRFGLDRLLLGYAVPGNGARLIQGVLPCDDVEGSQARALGALARFAEAAGRLAEALRVRRSPADWSVFLAATLDAFCRPAEAEERIAQTIRAALDHLAAVATSAGWTEPVGVDVVAALLRDTIDRTDVPGRFLTGGVTVCAMVPMRSIPFEVVCLLGLDLGSFPRTRRSAAWDRMAERPRFGDRARRDDDRTLFLEAIVSARRRLHVSWVGRGIRDDEPIQPSVVVTELLDHLADAFLPPPGVATVRDHVVVEHALQAFSPRYFQPDGDPRLFSFSPALCEASRAACTGTGTTPTPLLDSRLPELGDDARILSVDRVVDFFANPARSLLRHRLGLRLDDRAGTLDAREPFLLDGLDRWRVADHLLGVRLAGALPADVEQRLRASGALPHGPVGAAALGAERDRVEELAARVEAERCGAARDVALDVALPGGFRLTGTLRGVGPRGVLAWRIALLKARDRLSLWIRHLALLAADPPDHPDSVWVHREGALHLGPVADPVAELAALVALYWDGCHRLLPFAPTSSRAWSLKADPDQARRAALEAWSENDHLRECDDPWLRAAWRSASPLEQPDFGRIACAVYRPMSAAETRR